MLEENGMERYVNAKGNKEQFFTRRTMETPRRKQVFAGFSYVDSSSGIDNNVMNGGLGYSINKKCRKRKSNSNIKVILGSEKSHKELIYLE